MEYCKGKKWVKKQNKAEVQKQWQTDSQTNWTNSASLYCQYLPPQHCNTKQSLTTYRNEFNSKHLAMPTLNPISDQHSHNILCNVTSRIHSIHSYPFRYYWEAALHIYERVTGKVSMICGAEIEPYDITFICITFESANTTTACCDFTKRFLALGTNSAVMWYNVQL